MPRKCYKGSYDGSFVLTDKEKYTLEIILASPRIRTGDLKELLQEAKMGWDRSDRHFANRRQSHKELQRMGLITYETAGRYKEWYVTTIGSAVLKSDLVEFDSWEKANKDNSNGTTPSLEAVGYLFDLIDKNSKQKERRQILDNLPREVHDWLMNRTMSIKADGTIVRK